MHLSPPTATWTRVLVERGLLLAAPSTLVPVDLHLLLPDGAALRVTGRGTSVRMGLWPAAAVRVAVPVADTAPPELAVPGERWLPVTGSGDLVAPGAGGRLVVAPGTRPRREVVVDGRKRYGWRALEAARLDPATAAELIDEVLGAARVGVAA